MSEIIDDPKQSQEVWGSTTGGYVHVSVRDPKRPSNWIQKRIGGPGDAKLRMTVEEREFNQEQVAYGNDHLDPFTNGLLVRLHPKDAERGQFELNDAELTALLQGGTAAEFNELIDKVDSEVILRRMLNLAEDADLPLSRYRALEDLVKERYPNGKGSRAVEQLREAESKIKGLRVR